MGLFSKITHGIAKGVNTVKNVARKIDDNVVKPIAGAAAIGQKLTAAIPIPWVQAVSQGLGVVAAIGGKADTSLQGIGQPAYNNQASYNAAIGSSLQSGIGFGLGEATAASGGIFASIQDKIAELFQQLRDFIGNITRPIIDKIGQGLQNIRDFAQVVFSNIQTFVSSGITRITDFVSGAFDKIKGFLTQVGSAIGDLFSRVKTAITDAVGELSDFGTRILTQIEQGVDKVFGIADSALAKLQGLVEDLPKAWRDTVQTWIDAAEGFIQKPLSELPQTLLEDFTSAWTAMAEPERNQATDAIERWLLTKGTPPATLEDSRKFFSTAAPKSGFMRWVTNSIVLAITFTAQTQAFAEPRTELLRQEGWHTYPARRLDPPAIVDLELRGVLSRDQALEELRWLGFDNTRSNQLLKTAQAIPDERTAIDWWHRDLYTNGDLDNTLKARGWGDRDIRVWRESASFIPPVGDLITMAVREVFSPNIAEKFGQFQDFPKDFETWAGKQGVSPQWARNYWAAHWTLPSVQMAFEMLHRRVIDKPTLETLLRAQDIMPFWRDNLIEISYNPLTRVDVRRMHKTGVLSEAQVKDAYLDLGYDETNAERLTQFTLAINKPPPAKAEENATDLTRTAILDMFKDGVFKREQALKLLTDIGLSADAAQLYVESVEMDEQRAERTAQASLILEQAKAGTLSFTDAETKLAALGLESLEQTKYLTRLVRDEKQANKLPSRADLDRMIKAGIVTDAEYIDTMERLGYAGKWTQRFLKIAKAA